MTIWLDHVREFTFKFPDGHSVSSRSITTAELAAHGGSLGSPRYAGKSNVDKVSWVSSRGLQVTFEIHMDRATMMELCMPLAYTPKLGTGPAFASLDNAVYPLPLGFADLAALFGEPTFVKEEFLVAKWRC